MKNNLLNGGIYSYTDQYLVLIEETNDEVICFKLIQSGYTNNELVNIFKLILLTYDYEDLEYNLVKIDKSEFQEMIDGFIGFIPETVLDELKNKKL